MKGCPQKLVALPTTGEAFLLRRETQNILVDSGWNGGRLAALLAKQEPKLSSINIAVCTHADCDHSRGFTTLLKKWRSIDKHATIDQYWLPGGWFQVALDLINDPHVFVNTVLREMESFSQNHPYIESELDIDNALLDNFDPLPDEPVPDESPLERDEIDSAKPPYDLEIDDVSIDKRDEPPWMKDIPDHRKQVDYNDTEGDRAIKSARGRIYYRIRCGKVNKVIGRYWLDLIITANIIRRIANSAIGHKVMIRWFDYGGFEDAGWKSGGEPRSLIPINAVEQTEPSSDYTDKSRQLRLNAVNERCLSFYSPGYKSGSGVLFCGDSPMGHGKGYLQPFIIPQQRSIPAIIATAPHHGSQTNARAYTHILRQVRTKPVFWVRSGGTKKHPGDAYRSIPPCLRLCTWCPRAHKRTRYERFVDLHFRSVPITSSGYPCSCKANFRSRCKISRNVRILAKRGCLAGRNNLILAHSKSSGPQKR